jgi:hypothetical protein
MVSLLSCSNSVHSAILIFFLSSSWVYPTEIFPLASRAKGTAMASVAFSLAGGVINEIVPYLIDAIGFWVFILFALINLVMLVPIYLFYIGKLYSHRPHLSFLLLLSDMQMNIN